MPKKKKGIWLCEIGNLCIWDDGEGEIDMMRRINVCHLKPLMYICGLSTCDLLILEYLATL